MASASKPRFKRDPLEVIGKSKTAAAAIVDHLGSPSGGFDKFARLSDPNQIEPVDLVRVSMLGKPISSRAANWLLSDDGRWLTAETLADIPTDVELGWPLATTAFRCSDLLSLLEFGAILGHAQATRLLAAKRPALAPIDDKQIRSAFNAPKDDNWWRRWRSVMTPDVIAAVALVRARAAETDPFAAELSTLRIIDIAARANTD